MQSLLKSRKFWIMLVDVVVSISTYFVGKYLSPETVKDILFLIGALQPVVLLVISFIGVQNVTAMKAEASLKEAKVYSAETVSK